MFILEAPLLLLLLLLIPSGIYLRHMYPGRGGRIPYALRIWGGVAPRTPLRLRFVLFVSHFLFWTGIALLIIGLAGPGMADRRRVHLNRGIDIMLVVDVSPSMAIQDFGPVNRLESTRELLKGFVTARENDSIGIAAFGRDAALRLSPTVDHDSVLETIDSLQILDHGDGTAIGLGLSVAALHLQHSSAEHQVIIMLTDGANNAGEVSPQQAAAVIRNSGISLYVIGIGNPDPAPIEFVYPETGTRFRGILADAYDLDLLNEIADIAGGSVYTAGSQGLLNSVLDEIHNLEVVERRTRVSVEMESLYHLVLYIALFCMICDFIIRKLFLREVL